MRFSRFALSALTSFIFISSSFAQDTKAVSDIIGSAYMGAKGYDALRRICDEAGGRVVGSAQNRRALEILQQELAAFGCDAKLEEFTFPGWKRGADTVMMRTPHERLLRVSALGYTPQARVEAEAVYAAYGFEKNYSGLDAKGKIVLVTSEKPTGEDALFRYEVIDIAVTKGAAAVLFINDKSGGMTLSGMGNFQGNPCPIPAFSLTYEEGKSLQRLLESGVAVKLLIASHSRCEQMQSANAVVTLPGSRPGKIVIGAHFDSWDAGQGGVDNGVGSAILIDVARLIRQHGGSDRCTVECVWFNGEEMGLWGSKRYAEAHKKDNILAMINMDMTGTPTGFNTMGYDEFKPLLQSLVDNLPGFALKAGVASNPWTNSDHMPFMLNGVPCITLQAHLDEPMYKHYHDFGDTFDKVNKRYLADAAAVVAVLAHSLAASPGSLFRKRSEEETIALFVKHGLDKTLKRQKEWPWK